MQIFNTVQALQNYISTQKEVGKTIGFAPTMGALHQGHVSLIKKAIDENDFAVCSIFVNPTQFNEVSDLQKYPRTPEKDIELLQSVGCHVLFMPSVEEIYPKGQKNNLGLDFGYLAKPMEGANRPGHFEGMAQVVHRLLEIVQPHQLYMGQKDFQQFAIVQRMLELINATAKIRMCPIVREADGLAMSSRNVRLTPENRALAPKIYQLLQAAKGKMGQAKPKEIAEAAMQKLSQLPNFKPEYFELVDSHTLTRFEDFEAVEGAVACVACWVGDVRLIDNLILK